MSEASARLALPLIVPGQAQKELYHNEALARIDAALHAAVEAGPTVDPPAESEEGQCWIVAPGAGGAWSGQANSLACWTSGGWRFCEPLPGMLVWNKAFGHWLHWRGSSWSQGELPAARFTVAGVQVVGPRQPAVPSPSGGTTIDQEARAARCAHCGIKDTRADRLTFLVPLLKPKGARVVCLPVLEGASASLAIE